MHIRSFVIPLFSNATPSEMSGYEYDPMGKVSDFCVKYASYRVVIPIEACAVVTCFASLNSINTS